MKRECEAKMGIDVNAWRARIGTFTEPRKSCFKIAAIMLATKTVSLTIRLMLALSLMITLAGDVESNPGPDTRQAKLTSSGTITKEKTIEDLQKDIIDIRKDLFNVTEELKETKENIIDLKDENDQLRKKINKLEDQSRRKNLIFYDLEEDDKEDWATSEKKVRNVIKDSLKLNEETIEIERAHRLGRKIEQNERAAGQNRRPRPVIVKFSRFKQCDTILQTAKQELRNKDSAIRVSEDYSQEVREVRRNLIPFLQQKRTENGPNVKVYISFDKLVVGNKRYIWDDKVSTIKELYSSK